MQSWEILEKAQLPELQSRAILTVVELEITRHWGQMATKADLASTEADLRTDMAKLRGEFVQWGAELRETVHQFKIDLVKWAVGIAFGQLAVLMTFCYFLESHLKR